FLAVTLSWSNLLARRDQPRKTLILKAFCLFSGQGLPLGGGSPLRFETLPAKWSMRACPERQVSSMGGRWSTAHRWEPAANYPFHPQRVSSPPRRPPHRGTGSTPRRVRTRSPMTYQDFEIRIQATARGSLKAEAQSTGGSGQSAFKLPFPKDELQQVPEQFDLLLDPKQAKAARLTPEQIGEALYASLFAGKVGQRFHENLAGIEASGRDERLRIRLNFDLKEPRLVPLAALPWELIRDGERNDFLSRLRHTSLVR